MSTDLRTVLYSFCRAVPNFAQSYISGPTNVSGDEADEAEKIKTMAQNGTQFSSYDLKFHDAVISQITQDSLAFTNEIELYTKALMDASIEKVRSSCTGEVLESPSVFDVLRKEGITLSYTENELIKYGLRFEAIRRLVGNFTESGEEMNVSDALKVAYDENDRSNYEASIEENPDAVEYSYLNSLWCLKMGLRNPTYKGEEKELTMGVRKILYGYVRHFIALSAVKEN